MALSALVRIVYFCLSDSPPSLGIHLTLPVGAVLMFLIAVPIFGEKDIRPTAFPVWLGVIFFFLKSFTFESIIHTVLCIILYLTVLVLYTLTAFDVIPTKALLYPLFGLPLLYHILVEDMRLYILAEDPPQFVEWLPEISVLLIMASLFTLVFAMKKSEE